MFWLICIKSSLIVVESDRWRVNIFCKIGTNLGEEFVKFFCSGFQICDFFISYTNFLREILLLYFFFPNDFFNHGPCFLYITMLSFQWSITHTGMVMRSYIWLGQLNVFAGYGIFSDTNIRFITFTYSWLTSVNEKFSLTPKHFQCISL